ncbi:thiamine phosphate synthase [Alkaliphilus peptidifermentans]|uniref:Thiamine-phosphate synthase n=1 Tax=Alkaliphilus peptidifermentans DSM 18978 TaxID=1120976 RepID=A0A1G5FU96_9FIRM|nr:thiamine phosphate synthase [Alkaliphilus peptidifermentans]SCY42806.1 thiamine-phosphate pyrophosphorylase [Alkaliphilus peptidifermentans DSM 18978]
MKDKKTVNYGLYLVTDRIALNGRLLIDSIEEAILGGVTLIQLREKNTSSLEFYEIALEVKKLVLKYELPLIINDRMDIALAVDADGIHLGQKDLPPRVARSILGDNKIIGVSAATIEEAKIAEKEGADYIGVGALFPTDTKENTRRVTLEEIKRIKESIAVPVVGIGGINEENIDAVKSTGIDGVAVVSAILSQNNIMESARSLRKRFA